MTPPNLQDIQDITPAHHAQILRLNQHFLHWLSPLDAARLNHVLTIANYKRQMAGGQAILYGYPHDTNYPDHWNLDWLNAHLDNFFYIDRIIIGPALQGKGYGRALYKDIENFARAADYNWLACDVFTQPNNPGSHKFHTRLGFETCGAQAFIPGEKETRYYRKAL